MNEQTTVLEVIEQAADELDETEQEENYKWHERTTETTTVRALLKRQKEGRIKLPLCQRLYVWDAKKRTELLNSIKSNYSCGTIIVVENGKTQYLVDGLQRLTSCMYLSIDYDKVGLTQEEKKVVLDYNITLSIVKDMDENEIKQYFGLLNSGIALAAAVKERSKLSEELNNAILTLASHQFFRNLNSENGLKTSTTFSKSHHHEVISMNALLAGAGLEPVENKAKSLCKAISQNSEMILEHLGQSKKLIERLGHIYSDIDESIAKRSLNANYCSALVYIMSNKDYTDKQLKDLTCYIFAGTRPKEDYSQTTRHNAADVKNVMQRYNLICDWLENPPMQNFDENEFHTWVKRNNGKAIKDRLEEYCVDFTEISEEERRDLFIAARDGKWERYNQIIKNAYNRLDEAEEEKRKE